MSPNGCRTTSVIIPVVFTSSGTNPPLDNESANLLVTAPNQTRSRIVGRKNNTPYSCSKITSSTPTLEHSISSHKPRLCKVTHGHAPNYALRIHVRTPVGWSTRKALSNPHRRFRQLVRLLHPTIEKGQKSFTQWKIKTLVPFCRNLSWARLNSRRFLSSTENLITKSSPTFKSN